MTYAEILKSLGFVPKNRGTFPAREFTLEKGNHTLYLMGPISNGQWMGEVYQDYANDGPKVAHFSAMPFEEVLGRGMFTLGTHQGRD